MTAPISMKRFNVFSDDVHAVDFVVPVTAIDALLDDYWEIDMQSVAEKIMTNVGYSDVVAIFDETFTGCPQTDNLSRGGIDAFVYEKARV